MASDNQRERDNQRIVPSLDLPPKRHHIGREYDHHGDARKAYDEGQFEALPDSWDCKSLLVLKHKKGGKHHQPSIQNEDLSTSFPVDPQVLEHISAGRNVNNIEAKQYLTYHTRIDAPGERLRDVCSAHQRRINWWTY